MASSVTIMRRPVKPLITQIVFFSSHFRRCDVIKTQSRGTKKRKLQNFFEGGIFVHLISMNILLAKNERKNGSRWIRLQSRREFFPPSARHFNTAGKSQLGDYEFAGGVIADGW